MWVMGLSTLILLFTLALGEKKIVFASKIVGVILIGIILSYSSFISYSLYEKAMGQKFYAEYRDIGTYVRSATDSDETVMTNMGPHISFFGERNVTGIPDDSSSFKSTISDLNITHMVVNRNEGVPDYLDNMSSMINYTIPITVHVGEVPIVYVINILELKE